MRAHKIAQPTGFCRPEPPRRLSFSSYTPKDKDLQAQNEKLKKQLKQIEEDFAVCRTELSEMKANYNNNGSLQKQVQTLNNTIRMLKQELEFRAAEDQQVQKHIQNYQMMNQRLRDQVQRLQQSIRQSLDGSRRDDMPMSAITTISSTPTSQTNRGRSPMHNNYLQKQNHVLTPKSKFIQIPKDMEMEMVFREMQRPQKHRPKIHIT